MGGTRGLKSQEEPEVQNHRGHRAIETTEPQGGTGGISHRAERVARASQTLPASQPQSLKPSQHHIIKSKEASV